MNVNKAILVGRLTRDPDMRTTTSGQAVATISIATNNFWTDKSGTKQEKTEFHNVVLWGRLAEIASQYLTKGQECFIEGRLQTREYTAKDGTQRRVTEIVGENMQLGSRAQGSSQGGARTGGAVTSGAGAYVGASQSQTKPSGEEEIPTINLDDEKEDIKIEDVPF
ncbi:MAG TPA: single-stranded DNA-binding protein [Patescibacteria group bacterium]|nr:single-stranded DNA-binding protein [Patescibacteria group bacterium]